MNNPLVQPDPGLFIWTIVTFLVLLTLLAKYAWRPLLRALDARHDEIRKSLDDAERARQELKDVQEQAALLLRQASQQAQTKIDEAQAAAETLRESIKSKGKAEADRIVELARRQIEAEVRTAITELRRESGELAVLIASKLLHRNITAEDHERLIDESAQQIRHQ